MLAATPFDVFGLMPVLFALNSLARIRSFESPFPESERRLALSLLWLGLPMVGIAGLGFIVR